jgi:hypothetical protein
MDRANLACYSNRIKAYRVLDLGVESQGIHSAT